MKNEDIIDLFDQIIEGFAKRIVEGKCGGGETIDGQMVNYRSAVNSRQHIIKIRNKVAEIIAKENRGEEDGEQISKIIETEIDDGV